MSKFKSYCESFDFFGSDWNDQLFCFVILISKIMFSNEEALKISSSFIGLVDNGSMSDEDYAKMHGLMSEDE